MATLTTTQNLQAFRSLLDQSIYKKYLTKDKLDVLARAFSNWRRGGDALTTVLFKNKFRKDIETVESLTSEGYLKVDNGKWLRPNLRGFLLLLLEGNRDATRLRSVMDRAIKASATLYDANPGASQYPMYELTASHRLQGVQQRDLSDAVRLLGQSSIGLGWVGPDDMEIRSLTISDRIYKYSSTLEFAVDRFEEMFRGGSWPTQGLFPSTSEPRPTSNSLLQRIPSVHEDAETALANLVKAPHVAISSAKSALEGTMKWICDGVDSLGEKPKMPELMKASSSVLQLDRRFLTLGRTISTLCDVVAEIRNDLGNSHGLGANGRRPTVGEARIAVTTSLALAEFLLDRHEAINATHPALAK